MDGRENLAYDVESPPPIPALEPPKILEVTKLYL